MKFVNAIGRKHVVAAAALPAKNISFILYFTLCLFHGYYIMLICLFITSPDRSLTTSIITEHGTDSSASDGCRKEEF